MIKIPSASLKNATLGLVALCLAASSSMAAIPINLPGSTEFEGWEELILSNFNFGGFPGAAAWPNSIDPNEAGSVGNATFNKVSGNGYPAGSSVYSPFTSSVYHVTGSSFLGGSDLEALVFQIDMGGGDNSIIFDSVPTFSYNGGTQNIAATYSVVTPGDFVFINPVNPADTGATQNLVYQWDLSGIGSTITSYEITWTVHPHAQIYGMELNLSDTLSPQAIPEPSSTPLLLGALGALLLLRRKRVQSA